MGHGLEQFYECQNMKDLHILHMYFHKCISLIDKFRIQDYLDTKVFMIDFTVWRIHFSAINVPVHLQKAPI